jgi:UDP-N-acetylglucosamine--N-acetylmuramyl-(pentapeptide) pyrophosphoryl-undecaprenol N-acetylglucosamine transferase
MSRVLFAGGGTLGPVTPLLAVARAMRAADAEICIMWAGTDDGPEREIIEAERIRFETVPVAKLPRYASSRLLTLPLSYYRAVKTAGHILDFFCPKVVVSAGGYTAVPVIREAASRGIPCIAHQLDYKPLLSNRLVARHCRYVTTSFAYARPVFGSRAVTYQIPTPVRFSAGDLPSRTSACLSFGLDPHKPVLLVTGGGTGSLQLNRAVEHMEPALPRDLQIIHVTGRGKMPRAVVCRAGYASFEFLSSRRMITACAASDFAVSRAGFGAVSEFAALKKAVIFVPLPDSPQTLNAQALDRAALVMNTKDADWEERLRNEIILLMKDGETRNNLGKALHDLVPTDGGQALAHLAFSVMK